MLTVKNFDLMLGDVKIGTIEPSESGLILGLGLHGYKVKPEHECLAELFDDDQIVVRDIDEIAELYAGDARKIAIVNHDNWQDYRDEVSDAVACRLYDLKDETPEELDDRHFRWFFDGYDAIIYRGDVSIFEAKAVAA